MISKYIQNWLDIIENMDNDNTYKLVWGRSILEVLNERNDPNYTCIHFNELSSKIIKYYWNQIYFFKLTQGPSRKPVIEQIVNDMIDKYQYDTNSKIPVWFERAEAHFKLDGDYYNKVINKVSKTLTENVSWRFMHINGKNLPLYRLDIKSRTITFTKEQVKELIENSFILSQLLNYRWAQLLEMFNTAPKISSKVKGLSENKLRRNNLVKYRNILLDTSDGDPVDFYTGKVLDVNDISIDHVIPWSFMYSDDIWNLVITSKSNNSIKSNSVPTKEVIKRLKERNEELLKKIKDKNQTKLLEEAIKNNYVDKFFYSIKM